MAQEIRDKKKKEQEVYERLEQDLTLYELQEDKHIKQFIEESSQNNNDLGSNIYSCSNDKGEIRIADQNIFNEKNSGPDMYSQGDNDEEIEARLKHIQDKINNEAYIVDENIDNGPGQSDLFFATEIEAKYEKNKTPQPNAPQERVDR